jgi:hypothetical protein
MSRHAWKHALAILLFSTLTAIWMWPFLASPGDAIPGAGAGDNFLFVWNLWWVRHAIFNGVSPLWCPVLFVPFGIDLTLDTHTLLPTSIMAVMMGGRSVVAGTNVIICAHLFLNFAAAYALAYRLTRDWSAAIAGALIFGWSPYVAQRLLGHFNLIAAWVFPLTALLSLKALDERPGPSRYLLGLALAAIAYLEYYYAVYAAVLVVIFAGTRAIHWTWQPVRRGWQIGFLKVLAAATAAALLVAAGVLLTGGTVIRLGPIAASLKTAHNPIAAAWLMSLIAAAVAFAPGIDIRLDRDDAIACARRLWPAVAIALVCVAPLIVAGARLWLRGDYVSQRYLWRSAPRGIDVGTMLLGNPRGLLWGGLPLHALARFGIDEIEQAVWMAPAALGLCAAALASRARNPAVRPWIAIAAVFSIWALGPYVAAFGQTLPLPLPATLVRYVPIVANARIPTRAIVVVYLDVAMLAAMGFAALRHGGRRRLAVALSVLAIADLAPARPPLYAIEHPPIYDAIRQRGEDGAVCDLPLGLRDSFGETGRFDALVLWHQTIHERPIAGGFVSRLPPRIARDYLAWPVLGSFLRLSAGGPLDREPAVTPEKGREALLSAHVRFIVLDRAAAPPDLVAYVGRLGLATLADDGRRRLLVVP